MKAGIEICEAPFVAEFDYRITSKAYPASRDEPASPLEYEITLVSLRPDLPNKDAKPVDVPNWLAAVIAENLQESYDVCDAIEEAEWVGDADDRYDRDHDR